MPLTTHVSPDGEVHIAIVGQFDVSLHRDFRNAYENADVSVGLGVKYVVDLRDAEYMDSSALGMLLQLKKFAEQRNVSIEIINCNDYIKELFAIARFDKLFVIG